MKNEFEIAKFSILNEIRNSQFLTKFGRKVEIWTKLVILGGRKYDILDKIFLVSINMPVAQYKIIADIKSTLTFEIKQVCCNVEKCCISFCRLLNQYIGLQIKYLSIAGRNLDEN